MDPETKRKQVTQLVEGAVADEKVPKIYTNGFALGFSNADVMIVLNRFGQRPVAVVNLSYTLAKTLAQRLGVLISEFESKAKQSMLTTDRIDELMKSDRPDENEGEEVDGAGNRAH
jgi:hypothetical protein